MNLSIVVPIYNVESYLEACLNSIEPILSNENVELILVNDGSKDGSEDICYKYIDKISNTKHQTPNTKHQTPNTKHQTPNTKYIYQDNQGLSEARNTGIKNSNGKYIAFIDSDDFINCQVL
ncbi:TPA: glycosyltransferase family 2 protein, partial [Neisseria gonorrhoeae]